MMTCEVTGRNDEPAANREHKPLSRRSKHHQMVTLLLWLLYLWQRWIKKKKILVEIPEKGHNKTSDYLECWFSPSVHLIKDVLEKEVSNCILCLHHWEKLNDSLKALIRLH